MSKRNTLEERIDRIQQYNPETGRWPEVSTMIRAELDRLARQIRKLAMTEPCEFNLALSDVLDLIREAKL